MKPPRELHHGVAAEFAAADDLLAAAERLRALGYRDVDAFAPFDVAGVDERLALRPSRLGWFAAGAGAAGAVGAYLIQWYTNVVLYPLNAGGRPPHAVPAFLPGTFETMGLAAAAAAFLGLLLTARLPRLWHPAFEVAGFERASCDRYWVGIDSRDPRFDPARTTRDLRAQRPLRVVWLGGGE